MFSRHVSRSRRTVRSSQLVADTMTGSPSPAASRVGLSLREERHLAEALRLPDREGEQRRSERDDEERDVRPPAGERERHEGSGEEKGVCWLQRERKAGERPGKHRLAVARPRETPGR